ncbi:rod-determining factor RdfA [Natronorubrum halophilum]|uniref:rod-determining factor RdfA n=1 Tax=Natronorubrum halophilum TaxID=1702106 RepID=UPI000EF67C39|nr:rod-determining factor RdfA [Natronorubrum halophilum]
MTDRTHSAEPGSHCGCKLGRVADKYAFTGLDEDLIAYWTGDADEQYSTRKLATHVNQRILESALEDAGLPPKEGEVENTYRLLTDDVSSGTQVQTRNELERDGVPIEQIESDFVSHQTVYNHLTDCLDTSLETPSDDERLERSTEKLGALQNRTEAVTADTVAQLERNEIIDIGEFNVAVTVTVTCEDCFEEYTVRDLLDERSCNCQELGAGDN